MIRPFAVLLLASLLALAAPQAAAQGKFIEPPVFAEELKAGKLPPAARRVPETPLVVKFGAGTEPGRHGGSLSMLIGRSRDVRMLVVYGYARLVGYDQNFNIVPDILESIEAKGGRVFTMKLRKGHRWSDGRPFTTEDFRYYWEDVANNKELSPTGPPSDLLVNGEAPKVEFPDPQTVRYSWSKPNPDFLPRMAGASPLFIFRPAHYLKQFHRKYSRQAAASDAGSKKRGWAAVHNREDNLYQYDNPKLPSLQPWINTTKPPADRFVAVRNPYFHRVDPAGRQLPYIDRVVLAVAEGKLIPAKTGAGESDLQARDIQFNNFTFLKKGEKTNNYRTLLWKTARGSHFALFPNLNVNDPVWRKVMRDVRLRRALSLAIDRRQVNQVLYFGLANEGNNTVVQESPLYRKEYQMRWGQHDRKAADKLLDEAGLKRGADGLRTLPDGRPLEIIVETAGESTEQTDVLEMIRENWREVGVKLFPKPSQREVLRNRVFSGEALMSVWTGLENGLANPDISPEELAPTSQQQLQWPKFGQYFETGGKAGEAPDIAEAIELMKLNSQWREAATRAERAKIWHRMLQIHAEQQFAIGVVSGVAQPVVMRNTLRNVPEKGIYNWDPGAFFGIYRPDTFWISEPAR
ncbi:MAG: peptide ABC transporter substrate-binding protein [Rhodospirillales bacterium RIFCSPLOWO2_12_FULL_67_15]|nr:MAG: peptide ABC transporter substrate-binding protein [Rhodospirillales bacterium RIFCSPLOWO2_12_FULL_67_15]